jgi:hypothetical protein
MEQLLSVWYGMSGVAASALYVPQIMKYHRDRNARMSISVLSWGGWVAMTSITVLYAIYVIKSYLFATVATMSILAQLAVLLYGVHARLAKRCAARLEAAPRIASDIVRPATSRSR